MKMTVKKGLEVPKRWDRSRKHGKIIDALMGLEVGDCLQLELGEYKNRACHPAYQIARRLMREHDRAYESRKLEDDLLGIWRTR